MQIILFFCNIDGATNDFFVLLQRRIAGILIYYNAVFDDKS